MTYDIFVSYRRTDRELVAQIVRRLEENGVGVWYDAEIEGGADWRETIVEALSNSDMLVIFFSEACNESRQLKKELAVADSLNKPVVPILIEDTKPKGAFLYELADRNWVQAFPDPFGKINDIVAHLTDLAVKSEGGLSGVRPAPAAEAAAQERAAAAAADAPAPDLAAPAPVIEPTPAAAAPAASQARSHAPRSAADYVRKKDEKTRRREALNDILPFRWFDLLVLGPLAGGLAWFAVADGVFRVPEEPLYEAIGIGFVLSILVGFYGALVFPVRYYLRQRPFRTALVKYLISSFIIYAMMVAAFALAKAMGVMTEADDPIEFALVLAAIWGGFTVLAFVIYAALSAQRALRMFRRNLKKI
jgi:multisubunit Na+/H+ antiporter MnhC subunit